MDTRPAGLFEFIGSISSIIWAPAAPADDIGAYIAAQAAHMPSADTIRNYRSDLGLCQAWLAKPLIQATGAELEAYLGHLVTDEGLAAGTVQRRLSCLRGFFHWAVRTKRRPDDPTLELVPPRGEKRERRALTDAQAEALLGSLKRGARHERRDAALVLALYYTGMRRSEARGLDWEAVDLAAGWLRVFGKGKRERLIPIHPALAAELRAWGVAQDHGASGPVFTTGAGRRRISRDGVYRITRRCLERAGLGGLGLSTHCLRHTFATRMARALPPQQVQKLLGHSQIGTTMVYVHTELGPEARAALERAL